MYDETWADYLTLNSIVLFVIISIKSNISLRLSSGGLHERDERCDKTSIKAIVECWPTHVTGKANW